MVHHDVLNIAIRVMFCKALKMPMQQTCSVFVEHNERGQGIGFPALSRFCGERTQGLRASDEFGATLLHGKELREAWPKRTCTVLKHMTGFPRHHGNIQYSAESHLRDDLEMESCESAALKLRCDIGSETVGFCGSNHEVVDKEIENDRVVLIPQIIRPAVHFLFGDAIANPSDDGFRRTLGNLVQDNALGNTLRCGCGNGRRGC